MYTQKQILSLSLSVALLLVAATFVLLTTAGSGSQGIAESDQVLYLQYARNMAQGHPYVFAPGDAPSSGSTTHLYIVVLALLYKLGATGEAFLTASFILNSLIYLGIVVIVWLLAKRMAPNSLALVMALTVLSGHTISAVLKQTDIGLFSLLALSLFSAVIYERKAVALILAILCAFTRPEGFVFAISFLTCGFSALVLPRSRPALSVRSEGAQLFVLYGAAGAVAFLVTLLVNHAYTGQFQFMSVVNKGYFKIYPLSGALEHTLNDALSLIKGVFFGLQESFRQFYFFPALSGVLGIAGIMLYQRSDGHIRLGECWAALSVAAALLLVASSQFAGISYDRYLGWIIPLWIIYISIGWDEISNRTKVPHFRSVCAALLVLYQIVSVTYVSAGTYGNAVTLGQRHAFAERIGKEFDSSICFGSTQGSAINYFMPDHKVYNLWGITSPDFSASHDGRQLQRVIEKLKHRTDLRFDYWVTSEAFLRTHPWLKPLVGELVMQDLDTALTSMDAYGVYRVDWTSIDGGQEPQLATNAVGQLTLVDQLDIGYIQDEDDHAYATHTRLKATALPTIATTAPLGEATYSEAGRIVLGSESFTIRNVEPGKPLTVVMRTAKRAEGKIYFSRQYSSINKLELNDAIALRVFVDGVEAANPKPVLNDEGYTEAVFTIPGDAINSKTPAIKLVGDHISYAYWFYQ